MAHHHRRRMIMPFDQQPRFVPHRKADRADRAVHAMIAQPAFGRPQQRFGNLARPRPRRSPRSRRPARSPVLQAARARGDRYAPKCVRRRDRHDRRGTSCASPCSNHGFLFGSIRPWTSLFNGGTQLGSSAIEAEGQIDEVALGVRLGIDRADRYLGIVAMAPAIGGLGAHACQGGGCHHAAIMGAWMTEHMATIKPSRRRFGRRDGRRDGAYADCRRHGDAARRVGTDARSHRAQARAFTGAICSLRRCSAMLRCCSAILRRATPLEIAAALVAILALYRAGSFIHELTHIKHKDVPGFRLGWNALVGVPLLMPSFMYEGVHSLHHATDALWHGRGSRISAARADEAMDGAAVRAGRGAWRRSPCCFATPC